MEHEEQFVICSNEPHEEIGHEKHVKEEIKLEMYKFCQIFRSITVQIWRYILKS